MVEKNSLQGKIREFENLEEIREKSGKLKITEKKILVILEKVGKGYWWFLVQVISCAAKDLLNYFSHY